ncbi:MAG: ABC transporter substrate-binding protein [Chloroflexi bacterium]|nr:ABC transporter substrate-binding protein [Chloroflexota bacterium]BCY18196.1 sugar ABC transporter substrate-binding protein [Leptolinea sp. HRD-7]
MKVSFKKAFMLIIVLAVATTSIAAAPASVKAAPAEVNLWTYYGDTGPAAACVKTAAEDFNAAQKDYVLKIRNLAFTDFNQQVTTAIASGDTPDLMIVDNPDNARYAAAGALADISAYVKEWGQGDQFLAGPWNSTMYEGKNYGIPLGSNTVVLWINTDMAKAAGLDIAKPPKTWAEFATWAEKMTNKEKGVYGTALLAKKDETGTFLFLPWVLQNGADLDTIDSPEAIAALAFWTDLVNKGYAPKSAITDGFAEIYQQFTTGKAAMMISGTWNAATIKKDAPDLNWIVAELPTAKKAASSLGGENWAMFASSKQQDGAWAFLKFVVDPKYGTKLTDCMGYIPSRKDIIKTVAEKSKDDPTMQVFLKQMESAAPRGPLANWSEVSAFIQTAIQESLSGQKSPEQAMKDAGAAIKPLLKK